MVLEYILFFYIRLKNKYFIDKSKNKKTFDEVKKDFNEFITKVDTWVNK